jgi:hypothetical protein
MAEPLESRQLLTVSFGIDGPDYVDEGSGYGGSVSVSCSEPDEMIDLITVDWGDGESDYYSGSGSISHEYADGLENRTIHGTCDWHLDPTIAGHEGSGQETASRSIDVHNVDPTFGIEDSGNIYQGYEYTFTVSWTDPGDDDVTAFTIDWGDDQTDEYEGGGRNTSQEFSHLYWKAGGMGISGTAYDDDGSYSFGASAYVTPLQLSNFKVNGEDGIIYIDPDTGEIDLTITGDVSPQPPGWEGHMLWEVDGNSNNFNSLGGTLDIGGGGPWVVNGGADRDGNGQLDSGEGQGNVTIRVLPAPANVAATLDGAPDQIKVTWTYESGIANGFQVQRKLDSDYDWQTIQSTDANARSYTDTLPSDYREKIYDYRIVALRGTIDAVSGSVQASGTFLQGVTFTSTQTILRDNGDGAYVGPQWYDEDGNGEIDDPFNPPVYSNGTIDGGFENVYPVCYIRSSGSGNTHPSVTLSLPYWGDFPDPNDPVQWRLKGSTSGYTFTAQVAGYNPNSHILSANLAAWESWPQAIRDTELDITWKLSTDGGSNYFTVGESNNRVYVIGNTTPGSYYETVLDLGCGAADRVNMRDGNQSDQNCALEHIWSKFTGLSVHRVDGTLLTYYASYRTNNYETADLLRDGDGQCGAWAKFFWATLVAQGVTGIHYAWLGPDSSTTDGATGFAVANWSFASAGTSGDPDFPYLNTYAGSPINTAGTGYEWLYAEVTDSSGIAGQGNANPKSIFENHQMLKIWDGSKFTYYDPSYGATYDNLDRIDATIAGYYRATTFGGNAAFFFWKNETPSGTHLDEVLDPAWAHP